MFSKVSSLGLFGLDAFLVDVETDVSMGLPRFDIVGLPDAAVDEAKERVRAALKNSGYTFPVSRITVNLAPAERKKMGTVYDLPICMALLCATNQLTADLNGKAFIGELSLDGKIRKVSGALPMIIMAQRLGFEEIYIPAENAAEGSVMSGISVYAVDNVRQLIAHITGVEPLERVKSSDFEQEELSQELPDFSDVKGQSEAKRALESMRQPLEDGVISISRAAGRLTYPCSVMLVCAMNPCPCGYAGHPKRECVCTPTAADKYLSKISGPLLDRIDIHIEVPPVDYEQLADKTVSESSAEIRKRINVARAIQQKRFEGTSVFCNARMSSSDVRSYCVLSDGAQMFLKNVFDKMNMSARAYDKVLKIARTIADLDGSDEIDILHISEAVQYRSLDRKFRR